jgi:predicted transcriptional regulator
MVEYWLVNCLVKHLKIRKFLDLLEERGKTKVVTVNPNESVDNAIRLMLKEEYSQLPVVKRDKVVGVLSYESLAQTVLSYTESKSKPKFRAKDFMGKVSKIFSVEDDVINLLNTLAEKSYVLISKRSKVTDIITCYDAIWFFRTRGEGFLSSKIFPFKI